MANKSLNDFTSAGAYTGLEGVDTFYYWDNSAGEPRKLSLAQLLLYILGGKTIGGTSAGDIVNNNAMQTLINKMLTTPGINGSAVTTATGAEIDHCAGASSNLQTQINTKAPSASPTFTGTVVLPTTTSIGDISAAELSRLDGVSSNIQTQLNYLIGQLPGPINSVHSYGLTFTTGAGVTQKQLTQADLLTAVGLTESAYAISPSSIVQNLYIYDGGSKRPLLVIGNGATDGDFVITTKETGGVTQVQDIKYSGLTALTQYTISLYFKVIAQSGTS